MANESKADTPQRAMTRRELRLCELYLTGLTGAESLRRMGSKGTPQQLADRAYKMLRKPHVKAHLAERRRGDEEEFGIRKERILRRLNNIVEGNAKLLFDENGDLIPIHRLGDDAADSIAGFDVEQTKVTKAKSTNVEGATDVETTVETCTVRPKQWDPVRASEQLSRMMGWNKDKLELSGNSAAPPVIRVAAYDDNDESERAARAAVSSKQASA